MLTIGLMTGYGTKLMPPDWFWSVGAAFTLVGLAVLLPLMKEEAASASRARRPPRLRSGRQAAARGQPGHRPVRPAGCHGRAVHHLSAYLTNEIGRPEAVARADTDAGASGGSWGMLTIGLMTGYGTKLMPPDWFWSVGAAFTLVGLAVLLMKEEAASASRARRPPRPRATLGRQPRVASLAIALSGLRCHGRAVHHLPERLSHQ